MPTPILGIVVFRDLTERLVAEAELKELIDFAPFAIAINNIAGDTFKLEQLNHRFVELFGWDIEDISNLKAWFSKAYPDPDYRQKIMSTWAERMASAKEKDALIVPFETTRFLQNHIQEVEY